MYRATVSFLILIVIAAPLRADDGSNDRRHKYGDGKNKDGAAYLGDQKSKDTLTPDMLGHYAQAAMKFASGDIAGGTMEQTKGDQLKQQISENKKSADKNRESEKLVMDGPNDVRQQQLKGENRVITVDKDRASAAAAAAAGPAPAPEAFGPAAVTSFSYDTSAAPAAAPLPDLPAPSAQLAQLGDPSIAAPAAPSAPSAPEEAAPAPAPNFAAQPPPTSASAGNLALAGFEAPRAAPDLPPQFTQLGAATGVTQKEKEAAKADAAFFAGVGKVESRPADERGTRHRIKRAP